METEQGPGRGLFHLGLLLIALPMSAVTLLTALVMELSTPATIIVTAAPLLLLQLGAFLAASSVINGHSLVQMSFGTLKLLQKPLGIPQHAPERMVIQMNNLRLLNMKGKTYGPGETLILLPHCLQDHTCPHRLTFDPDACQRCGNCPIGGLLEIRDRHGVHLSIATGGTSARKTVKDLRPKLIIAVACPVDLSLGILDVNPIDTVGILNEWRHGECFDTWVDINEVDAALSRLLT